MKKAFKFASLLLTVILMFALSGCVRVDGPDTFVGGYHNGEKYTLTPGENSLDYKGVTYQYDVARKSRQLTFTVTYPNGGTYRNNAEDISTNALYDPVSYAAGAELVDILSKHYSVTGKSPSALNILGALLLLAMGGFVTFFPEDAWYLHHAFRSWQYESVEPSDDGISWTRMGGIFIIIAGVIVFFLNWR